MRRVQWEGRDGLKHVSLIPDDAPDSQASMGIPLERPIVEAIDWDEVKRDLHNVFVERGLLDWQSVQMSQGNLKGAILDVMFRRVVVVFRNLE